MLKSENFVTLTCKAKCCRNTHKAKEWRRCGASFIGDGSHLCSMVDDNNEKVMKCSQKKTKRAQKLAHKRVSKPDQLAILSARSSCWKVPRIVAPHGSREPERNKSKKKEARTREPNKTCHHAGYLLYGLLLVPVVKIRRQSGFLITPKL